MIHQLIPVLHLEEPSYASLLDKIVYEWGYALKASRARNWLELECKLAGMRSAVAFMTRDESASNELHDLVMLALEHRLMVEVKP